MGLDFCYFSLWVLLTTVNQVLHVQDPRASPDADLFIIQGFGTKFKSSKSLILEQLAHWCLSCLPLLYLLAGAHSFKKIEAQINIILQR